MQQNFGVEKMDSSIDPEAWLLSKYAPVAAYFEDCDSVEYVNEDTVCVYRRIDSFLTLIYDETSIRIIGFKFKGFRWFYNTYMQNIPEFGADGFVHFVKVIEAVCSYLGDELLNDDRRRNAYQAVRKIAEKEEVTIKLAA
jgi:hypothetical protein